MKSINFIFCLLGILAFSVGCAKTPTTDAPADDTPTTGDNDDDDGDTDDEATFGTNVIGAAFKALPLAADGGLQSSLRTASTANNMLLTEGWSDEADFGDVDLTNNGPFRLECHDAMPGEEDQYDYCPEGTEKGMNNKFSSTTLIGLIFSADRYVAGNIYDNDTTTCSAGDDSSGEDSGEEEGEGDRSSRDGGGDAFEPGVELTDHAYTVTGSDQFIFAMPDHYDCLKVENLTDTERYYVYKTTEAESNANQVWSLFSSFFQNDNETFFSINSEIDQVYARANEEGVVDVVGINIAANAAYYAGENSGSAWIGHTVIMLNASLGHFMLKFGDDYVAIGKGGIDPETNTVAGGNFVVRYDDGGDTKMYCVNQSVDGTLAYQDPSVCEADTEVGPFLDKLLTGGFWSRGGTDDVQAFLNLTDDEVDTTLASWGAAFDDAAYLSPQPEDNTETYFPTAISE